jgi:hypothetical protein
MILGCGYIALSFLIIAPFFTNHRTLIDVCLVGVYLTGVHLIGLHFMGIYLMGMHLGGCSWRSCGRRNQSAKSPLPGCDAFKGTLEYIACFGSNVADWIAHESCWQYQGDAKLGRHSAI